MKKVFDMVRIKKLQSKERFSNSEKIVKKELDSKSQSILKKPKKRIRPLHFTAGVSIIALSCSFFGFFINYNQDLALKAQLAKLVSLPGTYLVVFQNDGELRPSGGFIGSYGTVDWDMGIKNINFGTNIYKIDKSFEAVNFVEAPTPLKKYLGIEKWAMRDSNWALDFRDAAQNMMWFYNSETDKTVDGVVAINTQAVIDLLAISGPIKLDKYNMTIDSGNFRDLIQKQVEQNYYKDDANKINNEPKEILADMIPIFEQIIKSSAKTKMYQYVISELDQKNVQFYSNQSDIEDSINQYNWGGSIRTSERDYLYINRANIGGAKSSKNVIENISYQVNSLNLSELSITRTHTGTGEWPDGRNNTYYRIVIPKGSALLNLKIDGQDFIKESDITEEYNKKVIGFMTGLDPGKSQMISLSYELPFSVNSNYSLLLQKQPGAPFESYNIKYLDAVKFQGELKSDLQL